MKWFRCYTDVLADDRLGLLAFEDRWHFIAVLAMKASGLLDEPESDLRQRRINRNLGLTAPEAENVWKRLREVGLIDSDWQPIAWEKRQYKHDDSRERVARYRDKKRHVTACNGDVTVTVTSTETDTETETDIYPSPNGDGRERRKRRPPVPFAEIVDLYHRCLPELPRVEKLTKTREGYIRQRWQEDLPTLDHWRNYFAFVAQSAFLTGKSKPVNGKPPFRADIEWLTRPGNYAKVAEEKYHG